MCETCPFGTSQFVSPYTVVGLPSSMVSITMAACSASDLIALDVCMRLIFRFVVELDLHMCAVKIMSFI